MREILFRGKRTDNGKWVYGFYVHFPFGRFARDEHLIQVVEENGGIGKIYEVIPETVGQFTGLTDKNATRIFEGDIVKSTDNFNNHVVYIVEYNAEAFLFKQNGVQYYVCSKDLPQAHYQFEVIGNIHDNPELLDGAE